MLQTGQEAEGKPGESGPRGGNGWHRMNTWAKRLQLHSSKAEKGMGGQDRQKGETTHETDDGQRSGWGCREGADAVGAWRPPTELRRQLAGEGQDPQRGPGVLNGTGGEDDSPRLLPPQPRARRICLQNETYCLSLQNSHGRRLRWLSLKKWD